MRKYVRPAVGVRPANSASTSSATGPARRNLADDRTRPSSSPRSERTGRSARSRAPTGGCEHSAPPPRRSRSTPPTRSRRRVDEPCNRAGGLGQLLRCARHEHAIGLLRTGPSGRATGAAAQARTAAPARSSTVAFRHVDTDLIRVVATSTSSSRALKRASARRSPAHAPRAGSRRGTRAARRRAAAPASASAARAVVVSELR